MPILNRFPIGGEPPLVDGENIFGVSWDGTSTTAFTRTDQSATWKDPAPYYSGFTGYKSPFDKVLPWRGIVIEEVATAGTCVKIPKFWYKLSQNDGVGLNVQIADYAATGFSTSPAHMDRGDGVGERDYVYVARYHCNGSYKSVTGATPKSSIFRKNARSGIHNLGSTIWSFDYAMLFTIQLLYLVEYANWHSQNKIGWGGPYAHNKTGDNYTVGRTDSMPYHTGTNATTRANYGAAQYRYIENLWGNSYQWVDGCYFNGNGLNLVLKPASFSDNSGGTAIGKWSSGFPKAVTVVEKTGLYPVFIPTTVGGSNSTYIPDRWQCGNGTNYDLSSGGQGQNKSSDGQYWGMFCYQATGNMASGSIGARLMVLP